ncbi:hypothetical protein V6N11_013709 [Hibiscus sabdariffa]|uniref:Lipoxygenase domain-containing protein n=1 Tax=Hibiscus sabdariffa TaxID=183260 RepID=A0ABR2A2B9_9ROSI
MTLEEALEQKKLFVLDYHDLLLPFVKKVRELPGTTLYGSRALFFLDPDEAIGHRANSTAHGWEAAVEGCIYAGLA